MIRGKRYITHSNLWLAEFIDSGALHDMDFEECVAWYKKIVPRLDDSGWALLGVNDRFFLLVGICGRKDIMHPWLFTRCREVEDKPNGVIDLWARDHYKSTLGTFAGCMSDIFNNPETTIGILSFNKETATDFGRQIKREFENNELMKRIYYDVLFDRPEKESQRWSDSAFIVKRTTNPKEATVMCGGLVRGQMTSKHFDILNYDDVVTPDSVTNEDMIRKVTEAFEMSDNLGKDGGIKRIFGTRYHFSDTYGVLIGRGNFLSRIYPATVDGTAEGKPVFLTQEKWDEKKKLQTATLNAQMLQNPLAGNAQMFKADWLRPYEVRPRHLNVYIMVDPSGGGRNRKVGKGDRTAIAVIGVDQEGNWYLIDGYRHRMTLSERWNALKNLRKKWLKAPGIQQVEVGYEQYGMQADLQYIEERMDIEGESFPITELNWPREGSHSKKDRVGRLEPAMRLSRFYLPAFVADPNAPVSEKMAIAMKRETDPLTFDQATRRHGNPHMLKAATWRVDRAKNALTTTRLVTPTRQMREAIDMGNADLVARPIVRIDPETGKPYDLMVAFTEEALFFPFGAHDDLIDAVSRGYDMGIVRPVVSESYKADRGGYRDRVLEVVDA